MTPELLALLIAAVAGAALAMLLDRRAAGALLGGEALLLGLGACAAALFILSIAGVPWSRLSLGVTMGVVIAAAYGAALMRRGRNAAPVIVPRSPLAWLMIAAAIVLLAGYARLATMAPLWEFDFIGDWGLKARAFFGARSLDWAFLEHPFHRDVHPDYPPLLPLSFDVLALVRGDWNDQMLGLVSVAFAAALLLVFYGAASDETRRPALAAFIALAMVPFACSPWIGLADGVLVAYATTGLLLIRRGSVAAGAVMLGLGGMTKNEGLTFIAAAAVALAADRRLRDIPRLWPAALIPLPWVVLRRLHGLQTDLAQGDVMARVIEHLRHPAPLLEAFTRYGAGKPLFWIALTVGMLVSIRRLVSRERFVLVALILQFLFYIGAYVSTPHDVDWHVHWSWERLISHLSPALAYVVLVSLITRGDEAPLTSETIVLNY